MMSWRAFCLAIVLCAPTAALAQTRLPIIDTHLHYSEPAWKQHPPEAVLRALDAAGVICALVSSSPDDGTLTLKRTAPDRVVPVLRPYRGEITPSNWFRDATAPAYLEGRLARGDYKGIGEFHLYEDSSADTPIVKQVVAMAVARGLFVHIHSGAGAIHRVAAYAPQARIFWAHAGLSEPPEVVGPLLDRYPQVVTEVSFRAGSIAGGGAIDPRWRDILLRHSARIMIGTDTYITSRWDGYGRLIEEHRHWLNQLPPEVAEAIAWRNAARLFGACEAIRPTN
jgi:predicted TIM-barrel fold metal-dependent hydrolase